MAYVRDFKDEISETIAISAEYKDLRLKSYHKSADESREHLFTCPGELKNLNIKKVL